MLHKSCHNNAIFDLAWSPRDMKLVTASGDHTAVLWDLCVGHCVPLAYFRSHSRSVKTTQFSPEDDNVVITGARDGNINVWDIRSFRRSNDLRPDNFISHAHSLKISTLTNSAGKKGRFQSATSSRASSITCLTFQDSCTLISCGAGDGCIKVWDLRKNYCAYRGDPIPVHNLKHSGNVGFTSLVLDPGKVRLFASCLNGSIFCYNIATYSKEPVAEYTGATIGTFYVKSCLSPDGLYLLSGSSDGMAYVWNTRSRYPLAVLVRNSNEVTCVAWHPWRTQIVTCSDDPCFQFWTVGPENKNDCGDIEDELCGWAEVKEPQCNTESVDVNTPDVSIPKATSKFSRRRTPSPTFSTRSPSPKHFRSQGGSSFNCPTSNLPNSVRDGKFHLHRCEVGREKDVNWLVKINKELKDHPGSCLRVRKLFTYQQPLRSATSSILPYLTGKGVIPRATVPSVDTSFS
ncbi:protein lethal(2)denticleless isoform X2 [Bacillus rossius redtenbacheri]|uniref:protein lethal(2)denticleless isoform X2 n=1 Tax=Bacillus rossius redtenbacheri TaxID=93214 RepID=UPI002FDD17D1